MAKTSFLLSSESNTVKARVYFLLLAIIIGCATSARILDEVEPQPQVLPTSSPSTSTNTFPSGQIPTIAPTTTPIDDATEDETDTPNTTTPVSDVAAPVVTPTPETEEPEHEIEEPEHEIEEPEHETDTTVATPNASVAPTKGPTTTTTSIIGTGATPTIATINSSPVKGVVGTNPVAPEHPTLSFFLHDIIGGSHPSARVVTGIVASAVTGAPFSKPNNNIFPLSGGTPLSNSDINGFINNNKNNLPFLTALNNGFNNQQSSTIVQNSGNNNIVNGGGNQPFVTAGQLPAGASLQKLMFGSVTVFDDELTEGHELDSSVIGKAQGFYLASSLDGNSHTMVTTLLLHGGEKHEHEVEDTISLFGVHRTASPVSHIAIIGGTGKYENACGYATVESLHQEDQHTTDGVDTIMQFNVYISE